MKGKRRFRISPLMIYKVRVNSSEELNEKKKFF